MSSVHKRKVLEETGGYDESLAYGEDTDFSRRKAERDYSVKRIEAEEYNSFVDSLPGVYRQGRWYGKSILQMVRKHPGSLPSLLSIGFFAILPFVTLLSFYFRIFFYLAIIQYALVGVYLVLGFYRTGSPYILAVPIIKVVRSIAEVIGIIEGFFTSDFGRE